MRTLAAVAIAAMVLSTSSGHAAPGDMKVGTYGVLFCGAPATFEVKSQYRGTWTFDAKIRIHDTGEYDNLRVTQYDDNSLRITRYLRGRNFGETQIVDTRPPIFENHMAVFLADRGRGIGCNNPGASTDFRIPR